MPDHVCGATVRLLPSSFRGWRSLLAASDADLRAIRRYEYLWEDGVRYKKATKLPAPEYVDALMNWAQNILDDEAMFPNTIGS